MIVPITCPKSEDEWKYSMDYISTIYSLDEELECYVFSDVPERPLLIKADVFSHVVIAVVVLVLPPIIILVTLVIFITLKLKKPATHIPVDEPSPEKESASSSSYQDTDDTPTPTNNAEGLAADDVDNTKQPLVT